MDEKIMQPSFQWMKKHGTLLSMDEKACNPPFNG
jgi:hypothetical protein